MSSIAHIAAGRSPRFVAGWAFLLVALFGAACGTAASSDDAFQAAADLFARQRWASAAEAFAKFLERSTDKTQSDDAHFFLGESLMQLGRHAQAREHFQQYLTQQPFGRLARAAKFRAGEAAYLTGAYEQAAAELGDFLRQHAHDKLAAYALSMLAVSEARLGRWESARQRHDELSRDHRSHATFRVATERLADWSLANDRNAWAEQLYRTLTAVAPSDETQTAALAGLGRAQLRAERWEEAAETFAQVLSRRPVLASAADAGVARGVCLERLGRFDPALALYDDVVARHTDAPRRADALLAAAQLRAKLHQYPESVAQFARLVAEYPAFAKTDAVLDGWAGALCGAGRHEEADAVFQRLCDGYRESPFWTRAALRVAQRCIERRHYAEAQVLLAKLLAATAMPAAARDSARQSVREGALLLSGQVAAAQSQWAQSRAAYEQFLAECRASPFQAAASYGIAESFFRQGEYGAAIDVLKRLDDDALPAGSPLTHAAKLLLAQALCHRKQFSEALAVATALAAAGSDSGERREGERREIDYVLGRCLAAKADYAGAREAYGRMLRSAQSPPAAIVASAQLMLAETYFHQKDYEAALREYLRLGTMHPPEAEHAASLLQAGKCCELLAQSERAAELYTQLTSNYSQSPHAQEAIGRRLAIGEPRRLP